MIPFALANWKWILPTAAALVLGVWLGLTELELANLKADVAESARRATEQARAEEARSAEVTRNLEKAHQDEIRTIENARSDSERNLAGSLRQLSACRRDLSRETADPGSPPGSAAGSPDRSPEGIAGRIAGVGVGANKLASIVRLCVAWAKENGR